MNGILSTLTRPYTLLALCACLTLVPRCGRPGQRRRLWRALPLAPLVLCSVPAVATLVVGSLEWQYPASEDRPEADAIVVLGGGVMPSRELDTVSLYRCLHAADLYRRGNPCLVLLSGGNPDPRVPDPTCADLMADLLIRLGVRAEDVIREGGSRSTFENAVESRKVLEERQVRRIVLVTDAVHLPRATLCFRKQGFEVIPSGCRYRTTEFTGHWSEFFPNIVGIGDSTVALHEWAGLTWYWLAGRI